MRAYGCRTLSFRATPPTRGCVGEAGFLLLLARMKLFGAAGRIGGSRGVQIEKPGVGGVTGSVTISIASVGGGTFGGKFLAARRLCELPHGSVRPVSYTHLDVYKRQAREWSNWKSPHRARCHPAPRWSAPVAEECVPARWARGTVAIASRPVREIAVRYRDWRSVAIPLERLAAELVPDFGPDFAPDSRPTPASLPADSRAHRGLSLIHI